MASLWGSFLANVNLVRWDCQHTVMHCPPSLQVVHLGGALLLPAGRAGRPAGRAVVLDDMQAAGLPCPTHPRLPPRAARAGGGFCDRLDRHGERCAAVLCSACKHSHACPGIDAGMRVLCTGMAALLLRKGHAGLAYPGLSISPSSFTCFPNIPCPPRPARCGWLSYMARPAARCHQRTPRNRSSPPAQPTGCTLTARARCSHRQAGCMQRRCTLGCVLRLGLLPQMSRSTLPTRFCDKYIRTLAESNADALRAPLQMWCQDGQYAEWGQLFSMPIDTAGGYGAIPCAPTFRNM